MFNCLISGVGGQGTVLASRLLAEAALEKGLFVRTAETIGMAQRGGSVVSHVRIGESVHSPLIPKGKADVIIALEPAEGVRARSYLSPDGVMYVSLMPVKPLSGPKEGYNVQPVAEYLRLSVKNLVIIDAKAAAEEVGSVKALNMVMLGAAVSGGRFPLDLSDLERAVTEIIREKYREVNIKAVKLANGGRV